MYRRVCYSPLFCLLAFWNGPVDHILSHFCVQWIGLRLLFACFEGLSELECDRDNEREEICFMILVSFYAFGFFEIRGN